MKTKTSKTRRVMRRTTAAEREELIKEYEASGLSRQEFTAQKGINLLTFHTWFRKKPKKRAKAKHSPKFVKVGMPDLPVTGISLVVENPSGLRFQIEGLQAKQVGVLLREVASC